MHPAYSVIVFTTLSGAGYGLLMTMAALALTRSIAPDTRLGVVGLGAAFVMIATGLLSSTAHLGRPLRAWRALSQWRTSWLSREGLASLVTFVPAGVFALGWIGYGTTSGIFGLAALLSIALALATVYCTAMIYQSLPTIRAWHQPIVTPIYCVLSLATGSLLAITVLRLFALERPVLVGISVALLVLAAVLKRIYWSTIDSAQRTYTVGAATGLGRFGDVRPLDPPHTQANYVMREMGYAIGRKHADKLRRITVWVGLLLPALLLAATLVMPPLPATTATLLAVVLCGFGVVTERWLFFAEAQHVVTLYYGAKSA